MTDRVHRPAPLGREGEAGAAGVPAQPGLLAHTARLPFHPFLLAAASVLSLFAGNLHETFPSDIAVTLAGVLAVALAVYLACVAAFRTLSPAAAISASLLLTAGLNYVELFGPANRWLDGGYPMVEPLPFVALGLAIAIALVALLRRWLMGPHLILNGIALIMVVVPAGQAALYEWQTSGTGEVPPDPGFQAAVSASAPAVEPLPDIYYLMFDRYASAGNLAEYFGYDDGELMEFLEDRGFYVARESTSNYFKTAYSVASTFHLDYLDALAGEDIAPSNWRPIYRLLDDHRLGRFLKGEGYHFVQLSSWWKGTQHASIADESDDFGVSEFAMIYWRRTVLRPLVNTVLADTRLGGELAWDNGQCQRMPRKVTRLKDLTERDGPTFVYAHFLVPHGPNVFRPDGSCITPQQNRARGEKRGYLAQVAYAGNVIRDLVEHLQSQPGSKPIIIVQADEGPFPERPNVSWREATGEQIRIKTGILNAYYFPDGDYSSLYPDITPVNSFRVVLDKYFGTGLGRLPDRVYGTPDIFNLYDFFDVTDVAQGKDED